MKPTPYLRRFLAIAGSVVLAAPLVTATTITWDPAGGGASDGAGAWLTAGDWWDGAANVNWTSGDDAIFGNGGAGGAVTLASPTTVNSLTLNSFTGTYTLGTAGQTITLNNGITMNSGAGVATIISPITLGAAQSWTNNDNSLLTIGTGAVTNAGYLLTIGGTGNTTVSSAIGGAGGLTKSGSGILTLSGTNTFSGQLTVANGTLSVGSINNVSANGTLGNSALAVILGSSGNTGTLSYTGGTVTSTKRFTFAAGGTGEINVSTGATTLTLSGLLDGTGNLLKTGAGTLTLSNNPNQFAGNTVITNGKVALGGQYSLWQSAYDTTGSTGAIGLNVTGQANPWLGGLAGSVNLATAITGYGSVASLNLNPQSGSSVSYGGVIANGAANMTLNKTGHGTQTLTGTNTYSGATTVWAGTLALSGASGTALNSAFTVRGGTLELDNSTNLVASRIADGTALSLGSLTLKGFNTGGVQGETVGATTFAVGGKVTVINGSTAGDRTDLTMGAVTRSVGAAIDFVGGGLGTLGGGADSPNVVSSSLPANTNSILPWATVGGTQWAENNSNSIRAYSGGFTTLAAATNTTQAQQTGSATLGGALNTNSLNVISDGSSNILALGGNTISFGSTNVAGTLGAILKSGTNPYTISGGTIRVGTGGAGTELITHVDGGALTISANLNTAIVNLAKGGTGDLILSGTRAANFTGAISIAGGQLEFQGNGVTLSGVVTGAGGLTVNLNAGQTLLLTNNSNSYAGPTIVKGGYLAESAYTDVGLPGGRNQTPNTNTSQIMSNLTLQGGVWYSKYTVNKDLGAGPGQVQVLAGTSGFAQDASTGGASSLTLDGGREIVWGSTYFNPTVFVHNTTGNSTLNLANGFDLAGSTRTVLVGDAVISTANGVSQLGGNIRNSSGTAGLTKTGIGTLLLTGTNTYNGATTVSSGILRIGNQVSLYNNTPASWTAANIVVANTGTLALNVGGTGQFTTGNVTTLLTNLGGANGTSTTGFAAGSSIGFDTTNAAGSTFTVADNIADSSGAGGGAVGVVKLGSNTLVLSGTNSYSGATVIRGGTLSLTGSLTGNTAISTADNNNGGGATALNGILNQSAAGVISGATASFTQGSSGTSILSGDNSYGGGTTLNAGTLTVGHANALGTGTGTIRLNGGTIQSSSSTARTFTNPVLIGGNFTVGGTGNMTFSNTGASALGATRTITVTNSGVNATFAQAFSGTGFGITKAGAGTLTLTGNNTYTGATTINAGAIVLNNDGDVTGSAITLAGSNTSLTVTGGSGVISTWNLSGGDLTASGTPNSNIQMLVDGAGTAGSARVINVNILTWGRTASDSTLSLTNGGQMNVNGEIRIGNPYYSTTGNSNIVIGGGTATSTFTGNNQALYIGYGERNASKDNDVTVNSGGVLTNIGNVFIGQVNYGSALGTATNNKLTVDGTGTASMASVTVGYGQVSVDAANANVVQVTNGGSLTTSGTNYIGRATAAGSTANANTATVTGTGSTWNAGAQTIYVGHTANATATSNNNILTVGTGGALTASSVIVGFGTGTETGNKVVLNGGSITSGVTVQASNTLEIGANGGTLSGNITNNGTLNSITTVSVSLAGVISGSGTLTQNGSGTLTLTNTNTYNGATNVTSGTLAITGTGSINNTSSLTISSGATFRYNSSTALAVSSITNSGTIAGTGNLVGITLGGTGSVDPGNSPGILTATATDPSGGLDYNFEMTAGNTLPTWDNATASINDVLRLTGGTPFSSNLGVGNVISVYFGNGVTLNSGDVFTGGFYTDNNAAFLSAIASATFQYFVYNAGGGTSYNGNNYDAYTGPLAINVSTVSQSADFDGVGGNPAVNGYVTQFTVVPEPGAAFIGSLGLLALLRRRRS